MLKEADGPKPSLCSVLVFGSFVGLQLYRGKVNSVKTKSSFPQEVLGALFLRT